MPKNKNHIIVVNEKDEWIGTMEKMEAHQSGVLHRAFSVFILNHKNEMLLQRRALEKYHSGGLWSNACCSHPQPGESTIGAAHRRLREELGFDCELKPMFHLRYKSDVGELLIENEYDHIYFGIYDGPIEPNPEEIMDYQFVPLDKIESWRKEKPQEFTAWFHLAMPHFLQPPVNASAVIQ